MPRIDQPLLPEAHRTVSINETYHIDYRDRLVFHTVQQELAVPETSNAPLTGFSQYVEHGAILEIQPISGCLVGDIQPVVTGHPLHMIDFALEEPLAPGDRATVEYTTWFTSELAWRATDCCRRYIGSNALDHLEFAVQFDDWEPTSVWQAEWDPRLPSDSPPLPHVLKGLELTSGAPDNPSVMIALREDRNLAAGSVVGIQWSGEVLRSI